MNQLPIVNVKDKRVLVIGGSGVLGRAIASAFVQESAKVAISGTKQEKTQNIANEISSSNNQVLSLVINACEKESLETACSQIQDSWNGIDVLINAAGGNAPGATVMPEASFFDLNLNDVEDVIKLNLFGGGILPIQVFGKLMQEQKKPCSIINISSMAALVPLTRVVGYSAAKAAIDNLTRWLAVEFAQKYGKLIRVNAIAPGFFLTEQNRFLLTKEETGELSERGQQIINNTPMTEFGQPEDLQGVAIWLASDSSSFVTGIVVPVDGGFSAFSGV